ncbi:MAG: hypothetical protein U9O98_05595 [Asgard group archaeon]|nr:hypothetical protein [Asgard group archaeon]
MKKSGFFALFEIILIIAILPFSAKIQASLLQTVKSASTQQSEFFNSPLNAQFNLKELSTLQSCKEAVGITLIGKTIFLADQEKGLQIINISNPNRPQLIANYQKNHAAIYDIQIRDNIAYLAHYTEGLVLLNISDLTAPEEISYFNDGGKTWRLFIKDSYAFVADREQGLEIIDIRNPEKLEKIGFTAGTPMDVYVTNKFAYVAGGPSKGLQIYKIKDKKNPKKIADVSSPQDEAFGVTVKDNYAFVASGEYGLKIYDIRRSRKPVLIYNYRDWIKGETWDVFIHQYLLYIADEEDGVEVLDITDPKTPEKVGHIRPNLKNEKSYQVISSGNLIFSASFTAGLKIYQWKVGQPAPITSKYSVIETTTKNFNHSIGPFQGEASFGNETLGLDVAVLMDVGLKSPINISIKTPRNIQSEDFINLAVKIDAKSSSYWAKLQGTFNITTELGELELLTFEDLGIPKYIDIASFETFIGENVSKNANTQSITIWEQEIADYNLSFIMTPEFNITGQAIVHSKINHEETNYILTWISDGEEILIPLTIPENKKDNHTIILEEITFQITDLRIDFTRIRFDIYANDLIPIYTWYLNSSNFRSFLQQNKIDSKSNLISLNSPRPLQNNQIWNYKRKQINNNTLFYLNGNYSLGDYYITLSINSKITLSSWLVVVLIIGAILGILLPWIVIITYNTIKNRRYNQNNN